MSSWERVSIGDAILRYEGGTSCSVRALDGGCHWPRPPESEKHVAWFQRDAATGPHYSLG